MEEIVMPRLSDTMEEGTILRWLKGDGEEVARGEELVEIETDKATMIYESDQVGVLQIVAAEGDTLAVGAVIARVGEAGDGAGAEPAAASPSAVNDEGPAPGGPARVPAGEAPAEDRSHGATAPSERIKASPLARRIAGESGIDLQGVTGSGPGGRIVKADVVGSAGEPAQAPVPDVMTAKGETTTVELSRIEQTIARRMAESKATIPDFTLVIDVDMEECVGLRT
ncbi:MAG TPA: E3 binding domain-containing protein, partial [bacterium]|nr:E3 binding domain-containing protein [bacterium]